MAGHLTRHWLVTASQELFIEYRPDISVRRRDKREDPSTQCSDKNRTADGSNHLLGIESGFYISLNIGIHYFHLCHQYVRVNM